MDIAVVAAHNAQGLLCGSLLHLAAVHDDASLKRGTHMEYINEALLHARHGMGRRAAERWSMWHEAMPMFCMVTGNSQRVAERAPLHAIYALWRLACLWLGCRCVRHDTQTTIGGRGVLSYRRWLAVRPFFSSEATEPQGHGLPSTVYADYASAQPVYQTN